MNSQEQTDRHAEQLLALENATAAAITAVLRWQLAAFARSAAGRMLLASADPAPARAALRRELALIASDLSTPALEPVLDRYIRAALAQGGAAAAQQAELPVGALPTLVVDRELARVAASAGAAARDALGRADRLIASAGTVQAAQIAAGVARQAIASLDLGARYAVNAASNSAVRQVAVALGEKLVWVAERDACVVCLALSGHVIDPNEGESFDEFATFDPKITPPAPWPPGMPLLGPPRHPHCRCQVQVWRGSVAGPSWPASLRHEALRSVLKGWSLPSESNAARLRAAEWVLRHGHAAEMPKSVRAEGERAVGRRRWERGRHVPRYTGVR